MRIRINILFLVLFGLLVFAVNSCMRPVTTTETKTEVKYKDTTIAVKGDDVKVSITDSLLKVLLQMKAEGKEPKIEYRNTPGSPTNLTVHLDDKGQLQADCKTDDQLIKALIKEITELKNTTKVVKETPQWMMYGMIAIIVLLLFKEVFNFIKPKI